MRQTVCWMLPLAMLLTLSSSTATMNTNLITSPVGDPISHQNVQGPTPSPPTPDTNRHSNSHHLPGEPSHHLPGEPGLVPQSTPNTSPENLRVNSPIKAESFTKTFKGDVTHSSLYPHSQNSFLHTPNPDVDVTRSDSRVTHTTSQPSHRFSSSVPHSFSDTKPTHTKSGITPRDPQHDSSSFISVTPVISQHPSTSLGGPSRDGHVDTGRTQNRSDYSSSSSHESLVLPSSTIVFQFQRDNFDASLFTVTPTLGSTQDAMSQSFSKTKRQSATPSIISLPTVSLVNARVDLNPAKSTTKEMVVTVTDVSGVLSARGTSEDTGSIHTDNALPAIRQGSNPMTQQSPLELISETIPRSTSPVTSKDIFLHSYSEDKTNTIKTPFSINSTEENSVDELMHTRSELLMLPSETSPRHLGSTIPSETSPRHLESIIPSETSPRHLTSTIPSETSPRHLTSTILSETQNGSDTQTTFHDFTDNATSPRPYTNTLPDNTLLHKILFHTVPTHSKHNGSTRPLHTSNLTQDSPSVEGNSRSNNYSNPLPLHPAPTVSTVHNGQSHTGSFNTTEQQNVTHTNPDTSKCSCSNSSTAMTNALKLEIFLLRQFLPREKTVKSSLQNAIKFSDDEFTSRKSQTPGTTDSTLFDNQRGSGVVCYDDRMSIASQEVECPKPTVRKINLGEHHLQQLLKNQAGNDVHSYISADDFDEVDFDLTRNKANPRQQLMEKIQALLGDQLVFHQNLRGLVTEYFISSKTRDILSLTSFLKTFIERTGHQNRSDYREYPEYFNCKLKNVDAENISLAFSFLEREMLRQESPPKESSSIENVFEDIRHYHQRSSKLLSLKDELTRHLIHLKTTFQDLSRVLARLSSRQGPSTKSSSAPPTKPPMESGSLDGFNQSTSQTSNESNRQLHTQNCSTVISDVELTSQHRNNDVSQESGDDVILPTGSSTLFECHGPIISELFASISSMLKTLSVPEDPTATVQTLHRFENKSAALKDEFNELSHTRHKRSVVGTADDQCQDQGDRIPNTDFHRMCSTCVKTTTLSTDFFPRHLTEKTCKNAGPSQVQSGTVPVQNGCLNEGGRRKFLRRPISAGGLCQQQHMTILLLHRIEGKCMKIASRGREFITDQWKLITYRLRTGCECVIDKNSQFAKYLTFG